MNLKRLFMPMLVAAITVLSTGWTYAQSVTCSLSTPLGATSIATATGHTEPIAAGTNGVTPSPGGGTLRITCTNNGSSFTAAVGTLTVTVGAIITNTTSHPFGSPIRVSDGTGAFDASNVGILGINNSAGTVTIGLGTPIASPSVTPTTGITFTGPSSSTFDLEGILVSMLGKSSVNASLSVTGAGYIASAGNISVVSAVSPGLLDPTIPTGSLPAALPPGSTGGPAVLAANGGATLKGNFTIKIQENYAGMLKYSTQFNGGGVFPQSPYSGVQVNILFFNLPVGIDISACSVVATGINGIQNSFAPLVNFTNVTPLSPILTIFFFSPMDLAQVEVLWLTCMNVTSAAPLQGPDITAQVFLGPTGAALSNAGAPLLSLINGQTPRYQQLRQPAVPLTVVSILKPRITSIMPSSGLPGEYLPVYISGSHLSDPVEVTFSGTGVSNEIFEATDTSIGLFVYIDPLAAPGPRTVTVSTSGGTSAPFSSFTVIGEKKKSGQVTSQ